MTRILSDILQAPEPSFQLQLRQLEQVSSHQNIDIKLSVEITQAARDKVRRLGLDEHDTTGKELYQALLARVGTDDARLERELRTIAATHVSAEADLMAGMQHILKQDAQNISSYSLKATVLKRLLKAKAPKKVQKQLRYRSVDAMLRNEHPIALVAAARTLESAAWSKSWLDSYKRLKASDFEVKKASVISPVGERWQAVAQNIVSEQASTVVGLPELGAVVVLPLPAERPSGMVIASVATALHELNSITATGSYLQASQAQADFAARVRTAATGGASLDAPILEQAMPWQLVQKYYARLKTAINEEVFGPFVETASFGWGDVEKRLADICPSMEFWQNSEYISFLHEGRVVSLNLLDAAINCCNTVSYEARDVHHAQQALWHELTLRYLNRENLEQAIGSVLRPQLAQEMAVN